MTDIIIDAGHGGSDAGAVAHNGETEKEVNLEVALYLQKRLREHGLDVALTRKSDVTLGSTKRTNIVKDSGASVCLSVHFNSFNGEANGAETIHSIFSDGELARAIMDEWVEHGQNERRVFSKKNDNGYDYYYMHRKTGSVATVILEPVFGDSIEDYAIYNTKQDRQEFHEGTVKATVESFGKKYHPVKETSYEDTSDDVDEPDYAGHWAEEAIVALLDDGILNGYPDGSFKPDKTLTRGELASALHSFDKKRG